MDAACAAVGRDPATLPVTAMTAVRIVHPGETAAPEAKVIVGTADELAAALRGFAEVGVQHLIVEVKPAGPRSIERFGRVVELLRGA